MREVVIQQGKGRGWPWREGEGMKSRQWTKGGGMKGRARKAGEPWGGEHIAPCPHSLPLLRPLFRVCVCVFALLAVMHVRTLGEQSQCCSHAGCEHESVDLSHWVAAMVVRMTMMDIMLWL